jgi:hypothetical protein
VGDKIDLAITCITIFSLPWRADRSSSKQQSSVQNQLSQGGYPHVIFDDFWNSPFALTGASCLHRRARQSPENALYCERYKPV